MNCAAVTTTGKPCKRRAQWSGLCFQHWRVAFKRGDPLRAERERRG